MIGDLMVDEDYAEHSGIRYRWQHPAITTDPPAGATWTRVAVEVYRYEHQEEGSSTKPDTGTIAATETRKEFTELKPSTDYLFTIWAEFADGTTGPREPVKGTSNDAAAEEPDDQTPPGDQPGEPTGTGPIGTGPTTEPGPTGPGTTGTGPEEPAVAQSCAEVSRAYAAGERVLYTGQCHTRNWTYYTTTTTQRGINPLPLGPVPEDQGYLFEGNSVVICGHHVDEGKYMLDDKGNPKWWEGYTSCSPDGVPSQHWVMHHHEAPPHLTADHEMAGDPPHKHTTGSTLTYTNDENGHSHTYTKILDFCGGDAEYVGFGGDAR